MTRSPPAAALPEVIAQVHEAIAQIPAEALWYSTRRVIERLKRKDPKPLDPQEAERLAILRVIMLNKEMLSSRICPCLG